MPVPEPGAAVAATDAADLALLTEAAEVAGAVAQRHFGSGPESWEKADGSGPVSQADLEIDALLRQRLLAARPGYGWLSEETEDDPARLDCSSVFIVDPIDGTRAFLEGQKGFCHAVAVARDGQVTAAAVHLPLLGLTYAARRDGGATLNRQPIRAGGGQGIGGARVLAGRMPMTAAHWKGGVAPPVQRHFRSSLAWRLCLVAEGRFDATLTLRPTWEWDIAAAALIAGEAGIRVTDRHGCGLAFNRPHPAAAGLIAAGPALHAALFERLKPA